MRAIPTPNGQSHRTAFPQAWSCQCAGACKAKRQTWKATTAAERTDARLHGALPAQPFGTSKDLAKGNAHVNCLVVLVLCVGDRTSRGDGEAPRLRQPLLIGETQRREHLGETLQHHAPVLLRKQMHK